ncbi:type IV toxin-antitoxin system AbiEi family antitoxin domain-containing protein [Amnibacterium endophyticum]|uniref:Type IV toxin-antitoxin system AbiEi family antitoxin domain-containing protein n=1 Tax=Amnibacterium endophyticum TaxID=2109337 RepID=A0ABW4LJL6_9MICO
MAVVAEVDELTSGQWGLLTAAQAMQVGVSRMRLSREVTSGRLERLLAGVYRDSGAPVDPWQGVRAAWLASDPGRTAEERLGDGAAGVVVGGATAAYLRGIGDLQPEPVQLYSPTRRQTERTGIRYRIRQLEAVDVTILDGLPVTSVERTLADLVADRHDLTLVVDALRDAVRTSTVDLERLAVLLNAHAARLNQPDGTSLLQWLADTGRIELHPARTSDEVRQRWLQQTVRLALPDLEPLRRTVLADMLDATRLQDTIAAAIRNGALARIMQAAATATVPTVPVISSEVIERIMKAAAAATVPAMPAISSEVLEQVMKSAAVASSAPALAALQDTVNAHTQAQAAQLTTMQAIAPRIAPALQAAAPSTSPNREEQADEESS